MPAEKTVMRVRMSSNRNQPDGNRDGHVYIAARARVDGRDVDCPAAQLLVGDLRRRGRSVDVASLESTAGPGMRAAVALLAAGNAELGLAVATADEDDAIASDVVGDWLRVAGPRTVLLASPRSFCAGVERAIDIVLQALQHRTVPVYVRKQIVHNAHVIRDLQRRGARFVNELDEVPDGATVVFSAHGVSPEVRSHARRRGLDVIDGTCPLVAKVHAEARRFADRGNTIALIGHAGHEEIEGIIGEAPESIVLVEDVEGALALVLEDAENVSVLTQTTLAVDQTTQITDVLRARYPALAGPMEEDICYATTNRQQSLQRVAADADVVLVVGSANSSNSLRLVEVAHRQDVPAYLIDDAGDIQAQWLAGASTVGLTAGASAPPELVYEVIAALGGLGEVTVQERKTADETVHFGLPSTLRTPSRGD